MRFSHNITCSITIISVLATTEVALPEPTLTEMVPMRDGVKLATDIYLPKSDGSWPVILVMLPMDERTA